LLYALDEDRWDAALCDAFGVPAAALPELLPSAGVRGELGADAGPTIAGVPLLALAGDQQAALVGNGGSGAVSSGNAHGGEQLARSDGANDTLASDERVAVVHFGTGVFALVDTGAVALRHPGLLAAVAWSRR